MLNCAINCRSYRAECMHDPIRNNKVEPDSVNDKALHKRLTDSINYDAFNGTIG